MDWLAFLIGPGLLTPSSDVLGLRQNAPAIFIFSGSAVSPLTPPIVGLAQFVTKGAGMLRP